MDSREDRLQRRIADLYANDPQFRRARPLESVSAPIHQPGMQLAQIVQTAAEGYADRPALGQRAYELTTDSATGRTSRHLLPRYDTITYRELGARVSAIASEWYHHPAHPVSAGEFVCTLGFTSTDYITVDLACIHLGAVTVPLQSGAQASLLAPIIAETRPRILAVSVEQLNTAVECVLSGTAPDRVIVFDYDPRDDDHSVRFVSACRRLANSPVTVDSLTAVVERGQGLPPAPLFVPDADENPLATLVYTSGSTGTPKGAMYNERMAAHPWLRASTLPMILLAYMPMSHQYGRAWLATTLANGGTGYFASNSDMSTLFDDLALVRPTTLNLVPRVCDMVFQRYLGELDGRTADEAQIKADLRQNVLGGRFLSAMCASAPLSPEMHAFMESCLDMHLRIAYGTTESGGIVVDQRVQRPNVIDYRLIDVPELGYFRTDKPHPRGELLVKTQSMMAGYYNRPDLTAAMFDEHGYYKTGDVMAEIEPDHLVYLDRRNNVLKLSQGEFVAISHLEAVYAISPFVRQIYIYGSSERSYLLAVVVPNTDAVGQADADQVEGLIAESLQTIAKEKRLNGYEIPRDFLIETEPFSTENGLLTGVGKFARPALKARYGDRLEQMYADLAESQVNELSALRSGGRDQPVHETVNRAVQATLGRSLTEFSDDARFTDLGGDSLSALSFSRLIEEIFEVGVPVGVIIDPTGNLRELAKYIESQRDSAGSRPTFTTVHGHDRIEIDARDITLEKFIDAKTLKDAEALPQPSGAVQTVLLTGATGFLGRFLCMEWLQRLAQTNGTLICIARGSSAREARQRIDEAINTGDAELAREFHALADGHLEVVAGDIAEPKVGLDDGTWHRLAGSVDLIVHPAALVNHVLPYGQLFGPNVVGTAEVVRMALTKRLKSVNFVSTVAAAHGKGLVVDEDADIRVASPVRALDGAYASGYGASKWAGEVLMREAHDLCGLPVAVFRPDMILAHSRFAGQLNVPDMFTRLMLSLVTTGIAPHSFYRTDAPGDRPRAHYDGLPVDFVAKAIAILGAKPHNGFNTYNVVNSHDDDISLDRFVDWLIEAGHPIERIDDYHEWLGRFETAMRALPDRQRQRSMLTLLEAFRSPVEPVRGSTVPAGRFRAGVCAIGPDHDIPQLSAPLIEKYVADLHQLGLL